MASFAAACRMSSRLAARQLRQDTVARGYRTSSKCLAAQNFTMPALSPTMTEGNITSWNVKEGDSFAAGDVLLEIETDKASMDVEAQEDGIMAKIFQGNGSKGIQVGTRIGVIAEPGDDLSTLAIPQEDSVSAPKKKESKPTPSKASKSPAEAAPKPSSYASSQETPKPKASLSEKQTYPLLPSVEHLIHENGLDASDVEKMTPSGPNNRLLKGDVLAYLGKVPTSLPAELEAKWVRLSHLDLSNIKLAAPKPAPKPAAAPSPEPIHTDLSFSVPISMTAVLEVQKRIESTLGVFLPISTFIARAADYANDDLPCSAASKASADELFNAVLGLNKVSSSSGVRGNLMPQILALPKTAVATQPRRLATKEVDVIDFLAGKRPTTHRVLNPLPGVAATTNIFSVSVPKEDEKRAKVFLERVKAVLEEEPGRLVL